MDRIALKQSPHELAPPNSLFARLREACAEEWRAYCEHAFLHRLAEGTLEEACFRHYLGQDYLFLVHLARAYALAVYKSDRLADMRQAGATMQAILDQEMRLHVEFCAGWALSEEEMAALPEATATLAYTRYLLERGMAGDVLDLHAALAPCVVGYGEIGLRLASDPATRLEGNPYRAWIETYAGDEYQKVARAEVVQLDRLWAARGSEERFADLAETFRQATRLEAQFWEMGLRRAT